MRTQSQLLGVARSSLDYRPVVETGEDLALKRALDELYLRDHSLVKRELATVLERDHGLAGLAHPASRSGNEWPPVPSPGTHA